MPNAKQATRKRRDQPGEAFKALMSGLAMKPELLSVQSGVSISTIYRARRGVVGLTDANVQAMARCLGVSAEKCRVAIEGAA